MTFLVSTMRQRCAFIVHLPLHTCPLTSDSLLHSLFLLCRKIYCEEKWTVSFFSFVKHTWYHFFFLQSLSWLEKVSRCDEICLMRKVLRNSGMCTLQNDLQKHSMMSGVWRLTELVTRGNICLQGVRSACFYFFFCKIVSRLFLMTSTFHLASSGNGAQGPYEPNKFSS